MDLISVFAECLVCHCQTIISIILNKIYSVQLYFVFKIWPKFRFKKVFFLRSHYFPGFLKTLYFPLSELNQCTSLIKATLKNKSVYIPITCFFCLFALWFLYFSPMPRNQFTAGTKSLKSTFTDLQLFRLFNLTSWDQKLTSRSLLLS